MRSVTAAVTDSQLVRVDEAAAERVSSWMAYEEFPDPTGSVAGPFDIGSDPDIVMNAGFVFGLLNFAFTDPETGATFQLDHMGRRWRDAEAMYAGIHRALTRGENVVAAEWMAGASAADLERLFHGPVPIPMVTERAVILNAAGSVLLEQFDGSFARFVAGCRPALYAGGDGVLERLIETFPRFRDTGWLGGTEVQFHKLAQLLVWAIYRALGPSGHVSLEDLPLMTAFADYVLPVALQVMGILEYAPVLDEAIAARRPLAAGSRAEVEIRANTLYATAVLTDHLNNVRPPELALIVPQLDYRLWKSYHATFRPHHLTRTTMY